jgi:hypothetical protein
MPVIPLHSETTPANNPYLSGMQDAWDILSTTDPAAMTPAVALSLVHQQLFEDESPAIQTTATTAYQEAAEQIAVAKDKAYSMKNQEILFKERLPRIQKISEIWLGHRKYIDNATRLSWWQFSLEELQISSETTR